MFRVNVSGVPTESERCATKGRCTAKNIYFYFPLHSFCIIYEIMKSRHLQCQVNLVTIIRYQIFCGRAFDLFEI